MVAENIKKLFDGNTQSKKDPICSQSTVEATLQRLLSGIRKKSFRLFLFLHFSVGIAVRCVKAATIRGLSLPEFGIRNFVFDFGA